TMFDFDPGEQGEALIKELRRLQLKPLAIILTHAHFDHIGAVDVVRDAFNIPVRVEEKLESIEKLKSLKLTSSFNPQAPSVELQEIATIEEVSKQSEITRYNQEEALSMAVTKKQDANTVEIANRVIEVLDSYDNRLEYAVGFDSADGIEKSVET
ncbi:MBL fold metallo-hydrolase, partial [Leptospira santarosai]|nr:MBL fold metallo-hydrolase [Leptospira santarosai]